MNTIDQLADQYIKNYSISGYDLNRPWGGFYYIASQDLDKFISEHFNKSVFAQSLLPDVSYSPKVLIINPKQRLSWQLHYRRKEIWSILEGPVGIILSPNDTETSMIIANKGDIISVDRQERHRIVGLDNPAIIAELWWHIDPSNPSDEQDIVRIQDDYRR